MKEKITGLIDNRENEMLQALAELVNIDSGSYSKSGVDRVGEIMAEKLRTLGFSVQVQYGRNLGCNVLGRLTGRGKGKFLLVGHMDTVFDDGTAAARPFTIKGTRAYGPGVEDMKCGLISLLTAIEALQQAGWEDFAEVTVALNGDEEIGSPSSKALFEREAADATAAFVLEPGREDGSIVSARKGGGTYELFIAGAAAHAGVEPEKGISAIEELAHKILALHRVTEFAIGTTVNVGVVKGGTRSNVVAEQAYAQIDVRVKTTEEARRVESVMAQIGSDPVRSGIKLKMLGGLERPPMVKTPGVADLCQLVQAAGRLIGLEVRDTLTGGGSDGNYIAATGTPVIDAMGPVGGLGHSDREYLEISTLTERCKLLALTLLLLSERLNGRSSG